MNEFIRIEKLIKMGYKVTYVAAIEGVAIIYTFSKEFTSPNRDPFGNATGVEYTRVDSVEVTYHKDGTIEITR